jgi:hypothetical protein
VPPANPDVHVPVDDALLMEIVFPVMVVFDDLDGVPVTVRQSPTATAP